MVSSYKHVKGGIMLELRGVSKLFSGIPAVDDVTFSARAGEVTGYLGPNGSGKSTTMKMITGLMEMTSGEILFEGQPIQRDLIAYKQRMGYVPEEPHLYSHLTGLEYLSMVALLRNLPVKPAAEKIDGLLRLFSLHGDRHAPISAYSKGMRQKVLLAAALLHNPDLILLDEPFSGLDVGSALVLRSLIRELAARGKVILFSSHELETVERISSRIVILHRGKIVADDSIERLRVLMELPTLEGIFSQLAVEQDTAAVSREIADLILSMTKIQFRVLYREFLFRLVDLELLAAQGDISEIAGPVRRGTDFPELRAFAWRLISRSQHMPPARLLAILWNREYRLIATHDGCGGSVCRAELGFRFPGSPRCAGAGSLAGPRTDSVSGENRRAGNRIERYGAGAERINRTRLAAGVCPREIRVRRRDSVAGSVLDHRLRCRSIHALLILGLHGLAAQLPRQKFLRISRVCCNWLRSGCS